MKKNIKQLPLAEIVKEIRKFEKRSVADIIAIGGLLNDAKEQLAHGEFEPWVEEHFAWSLRTAKRYRDAHILVSNLPRGIFEKLNISVGGLYALAELDSEDEGHVKLRDRVLTSCGRITSAMVDQIQDEIWQQEEELEGEEERKAAAATTGTKTATPPPPADDPPPAPEPPAPPPDDAKAKAMAWKAAAQQLAHELRSLMVYRPEDALWPLAIDAVGIESMWKLVETLRTNLNKKYSGSTKSASIKSAADRAAARSQSSANGTK